MRGAAFARLRQFPEAERELEEADRLCTEAPGAACGDVIRAHGLLANQHSQREKAREFFKESLSFARVGNNRLLEATALLNLGAVSLKQDRLDEALDWSDAAYRAAGALGANDIAQNALGNLGWAYYRLGDTEGALSAFQEAEKRAVQLGDGIDEASWKMDAGYAYMDLREFSLAEKAYLKSLDLAMQSDAKEATYNAHCALARLFLQTGDLNNASRNALQALQIAHDSANYSDELYPSLVQGQVAAHRGDAANARAIFATIEGNPASPVSLKWESQHALARLYEDEKQPNPADRKYREALGTFESARNTVRREDFQLSFLANASRIYDDYVHFLVAQGKTDDALRWADYNRARTLLEGLGLLSKGSLNGGHAGPPALHPREIARLAKGVLLFYGLGEKQSYLWAITPQKTILFPLPPGSDIEAMVQRYRTALKGPQDVLESSEDGRALYRTLIAPAKSLLANNAKVFIIPDGSLNNLNFETLIVADPKPHYWIEDADVVNASSLRVLEASLMSKTAGARIRDKKRARTLLLIGDSVAPSKEYPELPRAGQQMANVAKHFPAPQEQVYQRDRATPAAYLAGNPETFSHIHFVAHGTASRLSPLDSAIVLSKGAVETDSFKLYARDIVQHHLRADLVTISACYGAGERAYSGEGLVGLAWAFLRAGAHNVIAGLWEVTDESTEQLMDRFYDELDKGASPDTALRAAKLSLLHGSQFHDPFYWAPFQLYTGA